MSDDPMKNVEITFIARLSEIKELDAKDLELKSMVDMLNQDTDEDFRLVSTKMLNLMNQRLMNYQNFIRVCTVRSEERLIKNNA